jgi:hypothetical protein
MTELNKEIEALHLQVDALIEKNYSKEAIIEELTKQGLAPYYIETIIDNLENEKADKKSFRNSMIMGITYFVGGLLINIFSYTIAENENSTMFYAFWGVMVLGIVTIVRGFILYKK